MSLTSTRSHESLASALTAERFGARPFTYDEMRAIARASRHDNTVAVAAFPATATPDVWPGEPELNRNGVPRGRFARCRNCGACQPIADMVDPHCLECWITEHRP